MGNTALKEHAADNKSNFNENCKETTGINFTSESRSLLRNKFKHLIHQEGEIHGIGRKVAPNILLSLFPKHLSNFGKRFINGLTQYIVTSTTPRSRINSLPKSSDVHGDHNSSNNRTNVGPPAGDSQVTINWISEDEFIDYCRHPLVLHTPSDKAHFYLSLYSDNHYISLEDYRQLMVDCYYAAYSWKYTGDFSLGSQDEQLLRALLNSVFLGNIKIQTKLIHDWLIRNNFNLFEDLHDLLCATLTEAETSGHYLAKKDDKVCVLSWILALALPNSLLSSSSPPQSFLRYRVKEIENWCTLYDSDQHGLSINRFEHHVLSYPAPTVAIISTHDYLFLIFCESVWSKTSQFGGSDCSFVQIVPVYQKIAESNMISWNDQARHTLRGIRVQKSSSSSPLIFIAHDFNSVAFGGITSNITQFKVLGCGDSSAKSQQQNQKDWEKKQVEKSRQQKLRLEHDWSENVDRKLLEMAGVSKGNSSNR